MEPRSVEFADRDNLKGGVLISPRRNQEIEQAQSKIRQLSDSEIVAQLRDTERPSAGLWAGPLVATSSALHIYSTDAERL